uniref:Uncharacterized protein n=1 Tax=Rhizophora mucronata TaxID=61149 RepID=A0A2P2PTA7_RHIMU
MANVSIANLFSSRIAANHSLLIERVIIM